MSGQSEDLSGVNQVRVGYRIRVDGDERAQVDTELHGDPAEGVAGLYHHLGNCGRRRGCRRGCRRCCGLRGRLRISLLLGRLGRCRLLCGLICGLGGGLVSGGFVCSSLVSGGLVCSSLVSGGLVRSGVGIGLHAGAGLRLIMLFGLFPETEVLFQIVQESHSDAFR